MTQDEVLDCIQRGDLSKLQLLVEANVESLAQFDESGYCSLHWSATFDEIDIFKYILLKMPSLLSCRTEKGMNVLHICVLQNSRRIVEYLGSLESFSGLDVQNNFGESPLHLAAAQGNAELISTLIELKCDQSAVDKWGRTPVDVLIENGYNHFHLFDSQYITKKENGPMESPASTMINQNKSVISEFMTRLKSKPTDRIDSETSKVVVRHIFEDTVESVRSDAEEAKISSTAETTSSAVSTTATSVPSTVRRISISQQLEYPGDPVRLTEMVRNTGMYDINGRDMFGWTALHKVCMWDKLDLLEILLMSKHLDGAVISKNKDAFSALHCCIDAGSERCALRLLEVQSLAAVWVMCTDGKGRTVKQLWDEKSGSFSAVLSDRMSEIQSGLET